MTKTNADFVSCVNDPYGSLAFLCQQIESANGSALLPSIPSPASFILCNAGSGACEHHGISAAGVDPEARRLTPALDAEALVLGKTLSAPGLPVSPRGIVSPVVISRACLSLMQMAIKIVDCGSYYPPKLDAISLSNQAASCPSSGNAMPIELVELLFKSGCDLGRNLAADNKLILVAECVPGGTTTAFAVLNALGHEVNGLISSSLPTSNHKQRWELVQKGLSNSKYSPEAMKDNALYAVASVGDPMQAVVAGIAASASQEIPVVLGGGSQMLAVWAILAALNKTSKLELYKQHISIMSTNWVVFDPSAGVDKLAHLLEAPLAASCPNFHNSRHPGLQAYEEGNVKEGVGAGASMCLASMAGFSVEAIIDAIDKTYEELLQAAGR